MFDRSAHMRHKNAVKVRITMAGEKPMEASVFLKIDERLIDLLNDPRTFIPVKRDDGAVMILAKASIVCIVEHSGGDETLSGDDAEAARRRRENQKAEEKAKAEEAGARERRPRPRRFDPYEVLRVDRNAPTEEIKRAYKSRIKAVHPDSFAALELDEDITRAAHLATQKVNQAYDMIMRERQKADEGSPVGAG